MTAKAEKLNKIINQLTAAGICTKGQIVIRDLVQEITGEFLAGTEAKTYRRGQRFYFDLNSVGSQYILAAHEGKVAAINLATGYTACGYAPVGRIDQIAEAEMCRIFGGTGYRLQQSDPLAPLQP